MRIKAVEVDYDGNRYRCMPVQGYKNLYPGKYKCGKCLFGVIKPIIAAYPTPQCKRCGAKVRDIYFFEDWSNDWLDMKVYRYP